jgi:hypothetical protein
MAFVSPQKPEKKYALAVENPAEAVTYSSPVPSAFTCKV